MACHFLVVRGFFEAKKMLEIMGPRPPKSSNKYNTNQHFPVTFSGMFAVFEAYFLSDVLQ